MAVGTVELHLPDVGSLKGKRHVLKGLKEKVRQRFEVSVAEVDHHDTWQRAALTLACVTRQASDAERLLDEAERWLHGQPFELFGRHRELIAPEA